MTNTKRVKCSGGSSLLCLSQYLQQMSQDRKHLCTFTAQDALRWPMGGREGCCRKTGSELTEVECGCGRENCDLHAAGPTRCLSRVRTFPAVGVWGHLRCVYPFLNAGNGRQRGKWRVAASHLSRTSVVTWSILLSASANMKMKIWKACENLVFMNATLINDASQRNLI